MFKELSNKQITQIFWEGESPALNFCRKISLYKKHQQLIQELGNTPEYFYIVITVK